MASHVRQYHWPPKPTEISYPSIRYMFDMIQREIEAGEIRPDHVYVGVREGDWAGDE